MISILSQLTNTILQWLIEDVSMYIKAFPKSGRLSAPLFDEGLFVFVDLIIFCNSSLLFISVQRICHPGNKYLPLFGYLMIVVSVICILLYLVRLYVSFPTKTLRYFF